MQSWIMENEASIRMIAFISVLTIMAGWETIRPCRELKVSRSVHWLHNLGLVFLNTFILRVLFPVAAVGVATLVEYDGWGLLQLLQLPYAVTLVAGVILLDLAIYLQHVMVHALPMLWRLHRVHHADLDFDVTTGSRFHPIEIVLSMLIKISVVVMLGVPAVAVIIFEIILSSSALFNHANVSLPRKIDRWLQWFIVTPDMHRIHHSVEDDETNSNFGFFLSWWDRFFGSYRAEARREQPLIEIGIHGFNDEKQVNRLPGMLMLPFIGKISRYAINTRRWEDNKDQ